ncbi:MAG: hypothetical protein AAGA18_15340 [Verrucomicrobiota bacterium]
MKANDCGSYDDFEKKYLNFTDKDLSQLINDYQNSDGVTKLRAEGNLYVWARIYLIFRYTSGEFKLLKMAWCYSQLSECIDFVLNYVFALEDENPYPKRPVLQDFYCSPSRSIKECLFGYYSRVWCLRWTALSLRRKVCQNPKSKRGAKDELNRLLKMPPVSIYESFGKDGENKLEDILKSSEPLPEEVLDRALDSKEVINKKVYSQHVLDLLAEVIERPHIRKSLIQKCHPKYPQMNAYTTFKLVQSGKNLSRRQVSDYFKVFGVTEHAASKWIPIFSSFMKKFIADLDDQGEFGDD